MNQALSPMVSEFETQEQEDGYTLWLRQKYAANLADTRPNVSHDEVMTKARALLDQKKTAREWKASAEAELLEILAYISDRNELAAERLYQRIQQDLEHASEHPYLFKPSLRIPGAREIVTHPNYSVSTTSRENA